MTVSGKAIDSSRIGSPWLSQSVSPVIDCLSPMTPMMSPAETESTCLRSVGLDAPKLRDVFLLVLAGVQHAAVGLQHARVNADVVQIAVAVGLDFEDQPAERLVGRRACV